MSDKTQRNKSFLLYFVQQKVSRGKLSQYSPFLHEALQLILTSERFIIHSGSKSFSLVSIRFQPQQMEDHGQRRPQQPETGNHHSTEVQAAQLLARGRMAQVQCLIVPLHQSLCQEYQSMKGNLLLNYFKNLPLTKYCKFLQVKMQSLYKEIAQCFKLEKITKK